MVTKPKKKRVVKEIILPSILHNAICDICDEGYDELKELLENNTATEIINAVKVIFKNIQEEKADEVEADIYNNFDNIIDVSQEYVETIEELSDGKKSVKIELIDVK